MDETPIRPTLIFQGCGVSLSLAQREDPAVGSRSNTFSAIDTAEITQLSGLVDGKTLTFCFIGDVEGIATQQNAVRFLQTIQDLAGLT
jgi:hypothetical protein